MCVSFDEVFPELKSSPRPVVFPQLTVWQYITEVKAKQRKYQSYADVCMFIKFRENKKQPPKTSMFSTVVGTPDQNRTDNYPLGGDYYIHLTTEAYALIF